MTKMNLIDSVGACPRCLRLKSSTPIKDYTVMWITTLFGKEPKNIRVLTMNRPEERLFGKEGIGGFYE
ncbi:hypothetical protein M1M97_00730 [Thermodesulfovibrionales bacterium]|nr:hypothetical protein [Thermodesulfovibrionales bacterium]